MKTEKATFGAGCFWGVEEEFRKMPGVLETAVGYTGGKTKNPTYEDVCTDATGHIEAVQVTFDPKKIAYEKLLEKFWALHDPTSMDKQGPDAGTQYRSAIFFHSAKQKTAAEKSKKSIAGKYPKPIVTEIRKAPEFYKAEEYHQKYLMKRGLDSCRY